MSNAIGKQMIKIGSKRREKQNRPMIIKEIGTVSKATFLLPLKRPQSPQVPLKFQEVNHVNLKTNCSSNNRELNKNAVTTTI